MWDRAGSGAVGGFAWEYTHLVDQYFEERVHEAGLRKFSYTLLAVGGYGRGRLCPGSDIDILLLFKRRIPKGAEEFVSRLLFPLWDLNLDLGHGVRTISDCVSLAKKDFQVLASLLDARPLAGDAEVFHAFQAAFNRKVLQKKGVSFAESLRAHNETRGEQYGDASGMLEPELKNGLGGLRDGQQVFWLNRVLDAGGGRPIFLPEELARLREDQAFLNRVRTALHLSAGRKNDRLYFDLQPPTAKLMGFIPQEASPEAMGRGVEFFLSRLHQAMTRIKAMREALFQEAFPAVRSVSATPLVRNIGMEPQGIFFQSDNAATAQNVLGAFLESSRSGIPLSWGARRLVRQNPGRLASQLIDRPETLSTLMEIFTSPLAGPACDGLLETRLLQAIFPEFGDVEHLIQFNDYHVHPVGRHTLKTIAQLVGFLNGVDGWAAEIADCVHCPQRLIMAGFFHDLGKGEPNHSRAGANIARESLSRFGCDRETVDEVAFLVENHLLIPQAATRRDLSDERVVIEVAEIAGSLERLDLLYLLSVADSMATGPRAWNAWTQSLFGELYFKVRHLLEHGPLSESDAARQRDAACEKVLAASRDLDPDYVRAAMAAMPTRAFLSQGTETLSSHIRLVKRLWEAVAEDRIRKPSTVGGKGVNLVEVTPGKAKGTFRLTIAALDRTGLFATIAGAIALHEVNILAADLFTWKDGTAVDVFTVSDPPENLFSNEVWARISRSINYALTGKLQLAARLEERRNSPLVRRRGGPKLQPLVSIDARVSDHYTVVEVAATDRIGLLFDMASVLASHGVSIHLAKITTIKGRVADIFHVLDKNGQKQVDETRINAIRNALLETAQAD